MAIRPRLPNTLNVGFVARIGSEILARMEKRRRFHRLPLPFRLGGVVYGAEGNGSVGFTSAASIAPLKGGLAQRSTLRRLQLSETRFTSERPAFR
jgi:hypothetical protein